VYLVFEGVVLYCDVDVVEGLLVGLFVDDLVG